jgi:hypothetical protein
MEPEPVIVTIALNGSSSPEVGAKAGLEREEMEVAVVVD